jgi:hypothetical protein
MWVVVASRTTLAAVSNRLKERVFPALYRSVAAALPPAGHAVERSHTAIGTRRIR